MFVNLFVENRQLCELYPLKQNDCDEMASVRLQNRDLDALQDYIDAQNGGPGPRLVPDRHEPVRGPEGDRATGKLAVIKGIEVSEPFGCRIYNDQPQCDRAQIDRELDEVYGFGVRQMELINKFDNALGGVAGDSGEHRRRGERRQQARDRPLLADAGVRRAAGRARQAAARRLRPRRERHALERDRAVPAARARRRSTRRNSNCNAMGLTELGEHAVRRLMEKKMIIDPDHLSVRARKGVMSLLEAARYSGAVSSHSWSTADVIPRIYRLGGVVTPMKEAAPDWIKHMGDDEGAARPAVLLRLRIRRRTRTASRRSPARATAPNPVEYPFKSFDGGVTFQRQRSGSREFDFTKDGVAHYGLFPDWWEDIRRVGGAAARQGHGARRRGLPPVVGARGRGPLRLQVGAPAGAARRAWAACAWGTAPRRCFAARASRACAATAPGSWCARGKKNRGRKVAAVARRPRAGWRSSVAARGAASAAESAWATRRAASTARRAGSARACSCAAQARKARFVYGVRKGRVRFVAVATRAAAKQLQGAAPQPATRQARLSH